MVGGDRVLEEYLKKSEVGRFIKELEMNPKYLKMNVHRETSYGKNIKEELALYLFYDIILKYKIIVDDPYLFDEFLIQVERLYRKIDDYEDMVLGVQKLLIQHVSKILDIQDMKSTESRREIITYFYQKYITNGYFVHGFSTTYEEFLNGRDFIPGKYFNYYEHFLKIQRIFSKYKLNVFEKDFDEDKVSFTDDFIMGCYYSITSPGYFYNFLNQDNKENRGYLKQSYSHAIRPLKRMMGNYFINENDRKFIFDVVQEEWDFLHRVPRKVSLLLIKRGDVVSLNDDKLNDYLESDIPLEEIIDRILSPKYQDISFSKVLKASEYQILSLDDFYKMPVEEKKEEKNALVPKMSLSSEFMNSYGMVSILLILGSLCITLGVILTIIMILRGM